MHEVWDRSQPGRRLLSELWYPGESRRRSAAGLGTATTATTATFAAGRAAATAGAARASAAGCSHSPASCAVVFAAAPSCVTTTSLAGCLSASCTGCLPAAAGRTPAGFRGGSSSRRRASCSGAGWRCSHSGRVHVLPSGRLARCRHRRRALAVQDQGRRWPEAVQVQRGRPSARHRHAGPGKHQLCRIDAARRQDRRWGDEPAAGHCAQHGRW